MIPRVREKAAQMREVLAWRDVRFAVTLFCAAQLLDGITTYFALASHRFQEANPLLGSVLDSHPLAAFGVKVMVAGLVVTALLAIRIKWRLRLAVTTLFAIASMAAPLVNMMRMSGIS